MNSILLHDDVFEAKNAQLSCQHVWRPSMAVLSGLRSFVGAQEHSVDAAP